MRLADPLLELRKQWARPGLLVPEQQAEPDKEPAEAVEAADTGEQRPQEQAVDIQEQP